MSDMRFQFGDFMLDAERYELRRCGEPVTLEPRVLELLVHLLRYRDRVVTKDELLEEVWEGRFVTESVLTRAVAEARKALGAATWIKTVYGRGYVFAGEVQELPRREVGEEQHEAAEERPTAASPTGSPPIGSPPLPVPLTALVGREEELATLLELLRGRRLVTLTGPGGCGKTRLALEVGARVAGGLAEERREVLFVPLAETHEVEAVPGTVARLLGLPERPDRPRLEGLVGYLRGRRALLILDNFEQILGAAPFVTDLLRSCPDLTVLVTSRSVLGVEGEQEQPVAPLSVAAAADVGDSGSDLAQIPAVALFLDRARAARPDFDPTGRELEEITHICRSLDGLPLALVLAAPLVKLFSPAELRRRLGERLDLLVSDSSDRPARHRSLEATLSWSYDLLDESERAFFRRLSVFSGGVVPQAAAEVADVSEPEALRHLRSLVDRSLVLRRSMRASDPAGESRFELLETTRELARRRLRQTGEETAAVEAHALWLRRLVEEAEPALAGALADGDQGRWLARFDAEYDNLVAAVEGAAAVGRVEDALAIATASWRYASARGLYREAHDRLRKLLENPAAAGVDARLRARALTALGGLAHLLCELQESGIRLEEARALWEEVGDRRGVADVLNHLGWVKAQLGELDRATELSRRALELHRELDDLRGQGVAWNNLAWVAQYGGDWQRAAELFERSFDTRHACGDDRGAAFARILRAQALVFLDRLPEAREAQREAAEEAERLGDRPLEAFVLLVAGLLALRQERLEKAEDLLRRSVVVWREVGQLAGVSWALACLGEACLAGERLEQAREALEESIRVAREIGAAWDLAQALRHRAELARREGADKEARVLDEEASTLFARLERPRARFTP